MDEDDWKVERARLESQRDILIRNSEELHDTIRELRGQVAQLQAENLRLGKSLATHATQAQLKDEALRDLRAEVTRLETGRLEHPPFPPRAPWWRFWR